MAKERKSKTLTYKHATFTHSGPVLRELLAKSLQAAPKIGGRRESLAPPDESPIWRLIGEFQIEDQFVFGVLLRYAPGTNPVFVIDDENAESLTVEQMAAPVTDDGKRRELVDAMLYFGVADNHLVMVQSSSLRSDHLEQHLQWLLHHARVLPDVNTIQLIDQPPKIIREKLAKAKVKELDIGGALTPAPIAPKPQEQSGQGVTQKSSEVTTVGGGDIGDGGAGIIEAIKRLLDPDKAAHLDFDKMAGANIEYVLKIKYRNATTDDGQNLMNTLGAALRHAESVDTKIMLQGGGHIRGDQLRLSGSVRLETYNGVPASSEVFEAIRKWLLEQLKSGDIEAS